MLFRSDTEEKAYWLGFIAADGYVNLKTNTLSITLSKTDEQTLHQFKKSINANNPIHQYRKITPHGKTVYQCNISIRSKKLISDLYKLNVVQNKSLVLKPSTDISDELIIHYIRGYYDGDGGIAQHRVKKRNNILQTNLNFTGTKEMLNYIDEYLYSKSKIKPIMYKRFKDDKNTHTLMYNGNITVIRIAEILYKSATVYMQRKYDLYKELFSLYDQNHQGFYVNRTRNMKKWYYDFRVSGKRTAKYGFTCFIDAYNDCLRALYNCGASPAIIEKFIVMNCNRLRVEQG
jgi:hypothetical protein